jgi:class 3 adenylate cyclase
VNCAACGHTHPEHAKFCPACGTSVAARCTRCGGELLPSARFCAECGSKVAGAAPAGAPPERAPRDYTPKHLADKILQSKSALEGERKQVTVLFADVKGSLELAGQLDAEQWHRILERFFEILTEGVHRFEGTVNQYTGDGIMALFGAPIAHEDHAQRACFAALHLLERLREFGRAVRRDHGLDFSSRIGLNSGEVVVGKIGDDLRMDYTAQGTTVGLAQRVEALAEADACFVAPATEAQAAGYFAFEDLGPFRVKGSAEPLRVYRLAGVGAARNRFDVARSRGLSRFVGRAREIDVLDAALSAARGGHGAVVGVVAQAGTGKSRLCFEFLQSCRAAGFAVHEGRAVAHGKSIPLMPILEIFRSYFGIEASDDDRAAREKIAGRLLLLDESFRDVLPVLFDFLGVADPARPLPRIDAEARNRLLTSVSRRLLRQAPAERPALILVEDLHWLDGASEAWLREWVEAVAGMHALLVVNYRPEYRAEWIAHSHVRQIALAPLGPDAIRELLVDLLGTDASTQGLAAAVHARSGGNPFFAEEIVRALIDAGRLTGERGHYRLVAPLESLGIPDSVQALLAARIDRLAEREKRVLQTAAVIGKEFHGPILERVIDLAPGEIAEALATLRSAEFVYEESLFPVAEYSFQHPLTQEVALATLLGERRRAIHAAVAAAIEVVDADRLAERSALLAHHHSEAGRTADAAQWHGRAASHAGKSDFAEARRHWQRVRELLRGVASDATAAVLGATACRALLALSIRFPLEADEAERIFEEGRRWAEATGEPDRVALLHQAMSVCETNHLRLDSALEHASAFAAAIRRSANPELRAMAIWPSLVPLRLVGRLAEHDAAARALADETRDHPEWGLDLWISTHVSALVEVGWSGMMQASLPETARVLERGRDVARRIGDAESESWCWAGLVNIWCEMGELDRARDAVRRSSVIAERLGTTMSTLIAHGNLAQLQIAVGDFAAAAHAIEAAAATTGIDALQLLRLEHARVRVDVARGNASEARAAAETALSTLLARGIRIGAADTAIVLATALRAEGSNDAPHRIDDALALAERLVAETGARNLLPSLLLERAAGLGAGDPLRRALLERAHAEFVRMGAPIRARAIEAELTAS